MVVYLHTHMVVGLLFINSVVLLLKFVYVVYCLITCDFLLVVLIVNLLFCLIVVGVFCLGFGYIVQLWFCEFVDS